MAETVLKLDASVEKSEPFNSFLFDIDVSTQVQLDADITDHYVEDNTAIQDHIAIKPTEITLKNLVGELTKWDNEQKQAEIAKTQINKKLSYKDQFNKIKDIAVTSYNKAVYYNQFLPAQSQGLNNIQSQIFKVQEAKNLIATKINDYSKYLTPAKQLINKFKKPNTDTTELRNKAIVETKQQKVYKVLETAFLNKTLVSVITPYKTFENCAIKSVQLIQNEDSIYKSDVQVVLKITRNASTKFAKFDSSKYAGQAALQRSPEIDNGKVRGKAVNESMLHYMFGGTVKNMMNGN